MLLLRGVTRRYGDTRAVDGVSLEVPKGRLMALAGGNGSGKTTLLRLAAGLETPSAGDVRVAGYPAASLGARRHVAWLGHEPGLYDALTVRENLAFAARFFGSEARVASAAERFGIADRLDARARGLSRGQRQRAALARAFLCGDLMLLDEPTAALDADATRSCVDALLAERGERTMLVATHDEEILKRADEVVRLDGGRLSA